MSYTPIHPDECHETIVRIEIEYVKKLIELRTEYIRQLTATTNSEEYNKVCARHRALTEELHAIYSYKQAVYNQEHKSKINPIDQLVLDYITRG